MSTNFLRSFAVCAGLLFGLGSCTELGINADLDIPADRALETNADMQNALYSAYARLASAHTLSGDLTAWGDIMADNVIYNCAAPEPATRSIYEHRPSAADTNIIYAWRDLYFAINRANQIIRTASEKTYPEDANGVDARRFKAECYVVRALAYFTLAKFWGPQYSPSTEGLPCVPLVLNPTTERTSPPLATVGQVYNQIIADLRQAASDPALPARYDLSGALRNSFGQASQTSAKALLAKVYFQMGTPETYRQAYDLINELLGPVTFTNTVTNPGQLNTALTQGYPANFPLYYISSPTAYLELFSTSGRSVSSAGTGYESLLFLMNSLSRTAEEGSSRLNRYYVSGGQPGEYLAPFYLSNAGTSASRLFTFGTDRRLRVMSVLGSGTCAGDSLRRIDKWNAVKPNVPVVRTADLLLMRIELQCRLFPTDASALRLACNELILLKFRGGSINAANQRPAANWNLLYQLAVPATVDAFLGEILDERRREMVFEGDRIHDLRRRAVTEIPDNGRGGRGRALPLALDRGLLPIPVTETDANNTLSR